MSTDAAAGAAAAALVDGSAEQKYAALAEMPAEQYDRVRIPIAKGMGLRVGTLDAAVQKLRRPESTAPALKLDDPVPWMEPVEGAEFLDSLVEQIRLYVVMPAPSLVAAALWVVMTYAVESFFLLPMLHISSPQKRSGKSTLMMVLGELCRRSLLASNVSKASIFRIVDRYKPALLLDECDTYFKDDDELRGLINCGHSRKTALVIRLDANTFEPLTFDCFCPKALAGIGSLADTITDRSITIELKRRAPGERVQPLRQDKIDLTHLRGMALRWAQDHAQQLAEADPQVPAPLHDRASDNWRPLLAIADLAGGSWPDRARTAALALSGNDRDADDSNVTLLGDIRDVFQSSSGRMSSHDLCSALAQLTDRPWSEWKHGKAISPPQLARQLRPFGVATRILRTGQHVFRGYDLEDFADTFSRYLENHEKSVTSLQTLENRGESPNFSVTPHSGCNTFSVTQENRVTEKSGEFAEKNSTCNDVTEKSEKTGVLEL